MKFYERSSFHICAGLVVISILVIIFVIGVAGRKKRALDHGTKLAKISAEIPLGMPVEDVKTIFKKHCWPDSMIATFPQMMDISTPVETYSRDWILMIGLQDSHVTGIRFGIMDDKRIRPDGSPADRGKTDFW